MRYATQTLTGLLAILTIFGAQAGYLRTGAPHAYAQAVYGVGSDEGGVFDADSAATLELGRARRVARR